MKEINFRKNSPNGKVMKYEDLPEDVKELTDDLEMHLLEVGEKVVYFEVETKNGLFILPGNDRDLNESNLISEEVNMEQVEFYEFPGDWHLCFLKIEEGKNFGLVIVSCDEEPYSVIKVKRGIGQSQKLLDI